MRTCLLLAALVVFGAACGSSPARLGTATSPPAPPSSTVSLTSSPAEPPLPPSPTVTPTPVEGTTQAQVNVRSGPGTSYASLGLINPGQKVQIFAKDADGKWYAILYSAGAGGRGWVAAAYIQVGNAAGIPLATRVTTATPSGPTGVVLQKLNVRSGPGTGYDSLGMLAAQSVVVLTGKNAASSWLQIEYAAAPGGHAWVTAAYIRVGDTSGLPVLDEYGHPVAAGIQTGTPGLYLTPTPTVGLAWEDHDSAGRPAVKITFSPTGTRQFTYSGQLSVPQGDGQDWLEFTPYAPPGSGLADLTASLICSGNGTIAVELLQNDTPLTGWGTLQCGNVNASVSVTAGGTYQFHLRAVGGGGQTLVAYSLAVQNAP